MPLESDGAFAEALCFFSVVVGFGVDVGHLAIDGNGDFLAFDLDVVGEPFAVLVAGFLDILHAVDASGFTPVLMGGVDLTFVALRGPAFVLKLGVDEDASIRVLGGLYFALELEVLKLGIPVLAVEEMGTRSLDLDGAVLDGESFGILRVDLPALESFSIEHLDPLSGKGERAGGCEDDECKSLHSGGKILAGGAQSFAVMISGRGQDRLFL